MFRELLTGAIVAMLYVSVKEEDFKVMLLPMGRMCERLERWELASTYFQSYMDAVGVRHPRWHEAADELERCREELKWKALRQKAQNHVRLEEWELAIKDFDRYVNNVGVLHPTRREASEERRRCRRELKEKKKKAKAAEDERRKEPLRTARKLKCLEQWESAISDYQRYLNDVGVRHPTWHEVADELDECRQKLEEEKRARVAEKRKKVEDEKRKELLRKARSHKCLEQWELAITDYENYLNGLGDHHPTSLEVAEELDHCRQEQAKVRAAEEEQAKVRAAEEERKAEDEMRRKAAEEAAQEEAAREEGNGGGHYATLWVRSNAKPKEIKDAYRKLALRHHPDKNPDDSNAARRFRAVNEAYEVLTDQDARREYNRKLDDQERIEHNRRYDDFMRRRTTS